MEWFIGIATLSFVGFVVVLLLQMLVRHEAREVFRQEMKKLARETPEGK